MKTLRFALPILLALLPCSALSWHAHAQVSGYQVVTSPSGYQFQVPSDWVPGITELPTDMLVGSATSPAAAYVFVKSPNGQTSADRLQALLASSLTATDVQSSYVVTNPSSPVDVLGADVAVGAAATYTAEDGTAGQEYIIAAVKASTGYALIIDVPASFDAASPDVAQIVLGSFHLTAAGATPVTSAPAAAAAPPASAPVASVPTAVTPATSAPVAAAPAAAPPATPAAVASAPAGAAPTSHSYFASKAANANTIYCDTDPGWQRLTPADVVTFSTLDGAMAALPGYHLNQPC